MDEFFMLHALEEAKKAYKTKEVPVGAVLVFQNKIISRGHNQVELLKNATAHAEMLCIEQGFAVLNNWRLLDCTLYSTLEPCSMCAGALILSRIKRVVWGASDFRHGAGGSWSDILNKHHPIHSIETSQGILKEEISHLMKDFFCERRKWKNCLTN